MQEPQRTYMTIRETAKCGDFSERFLRLLVAQGRCPGVYSGNRFYVNVPLLKRQMENESNSKQNEQGGRF